jgi:hypothetical protein
LEINAQILARLLGFCFQEGEFRQQQGAAFCFP